jgi:hypothetical protein
MDMVTELLQFKNWMVVCASVRLTLGGSVRFGAIYSGLRSTKLLSDNKPQTTTHNLVHTRVW